MPPRSPEMDAEAARFTRRLGVEVNQSLQARKKVAVLFAQVQGLSETSLGPTTRSRVLGELVVSWGSLLGPEDSLFHTGVDEFALICSRLSDPMRAVALADSIHGLTGDHRVGRRLHRRLDLSVTVAFLGG